MSECVECCDGNEALVDDYLCQGHRDVVEGARYCKECRKRWIPELDSKAILCTSCADKEKCEYCGTLYSEKYLISRAKPKRRKEGEKQDLAYGVRFKGLCKACKEIALESVPSSFDNHMSVQCPDCDYQWDVNLAKPLESLFRD